MLKVFISPSRYVQGRSATASLPGLLKKIGLGNRFLILASKSARKILEPIWTPSFEHEGLFFEIENFGGECSELEIERILVHAQRLKVDAIIGAGGGKVLDAARAVASRNHSAVVCCPTTASSDAPCSALSVIYSESGVFEKCLFYKKNPDLVLVDTDVSVKAPIRLLISGMGDALATFFEAQSSSEAFKTNPAGGLATEAAKTIARLCYDTLLQDGIDAVTAARVGAITPAFDRIVEANTLLSGLGFESAGLCVAHSIHNGLTALPETHSKLHGEKVAFGTLVQLVLEGRPRETFEEVLNFCLDVGLPVSLKDLGITDTSRKHLMKVAERSLAEGETAHNLSFKPTIDSVLDAILTTDALGEDAKSTSLGCECH